MPDTAYNLYHGSYYVTTRDALGCEVVDSVDITQPEPLSMEASQLSWISCYGADDGLAYAYALGGTPPYTFTWSPNGQQGDTINPEARFLVIALSVEAVIATTTSPRLTKGDTSDTQPNGDTITSPNPFFSFIIEAII